MGHVVEECGDGFHDPSECDWGDWLHWSNEQPMGAQVVAEEEGV